MKLILSLLFSLHLLFLNASDARSHQVMVSVAPYKYFVEKIAGDTVAINLIVPPGVSFHHFEPTPKQILEGAKSDIWFRIGESFENRALPALKSHRPTMLIVDLRKFVDLIVIDPNKPNHHICCQHEGADLHVWLSPRMVQRQVRAIVDALATVYPENRDLYRKNGQKIDEELSALDREIAEKMKQLPSRTILVSHPAYAYFARDYDLEQLPIEYEGKEPSPKQITNLLQEARNKRIKTIFVQNQYSVKGARLLAKELGAQIVELDPYSGDYFVTLREITERISQQR